MSEGEIFTRLGLALAIGFLVGIERGWGSRTEAEGERAAGLRTFALIAFSGGIWGLLLEKIGPFGFAAGFLADAANRARTVALASRRTCRASAIQAFPDQRR